MAQKRAESAAEGTDTRQEQPGAGTLGFLLPLPLLQETRSAGCAHRADFLNTCAMGTALPSVHECLYSAWGPRGKEHFKCQVLKL